MEDTWGGHLSQRIWYDNFLDLYVNEHLTLSAAEETAANFLGRALATAEIGGRHGYLFSLQMLNTIGREIVLNGESLWKYDSNQLVWQQNIPPRYKDPVFGDPNFNLMQFAIHINWQTGRGVSAMRCAGRWQRLLQQLERGLEIESRSTPFYPTPVPGGQSFAQALKAEFRKLLSRKPVRTDDPDDADDDKTLGGDTGTFVEGEQSSGISSYQPTGNYQQKRLGTDIPPNMQSMMIMAIDVALPTMGLPKALYNPADSNSMREAWRIYLSMTVESTTKIIVQEAGRIGLDLVLTLPELKSSDLAARARAFGDLVKAGMPMEQAAGVSGILMEMQHA